MAGLIARLFGGQSQPPYPYDQEPNPGLGGVTTGTGPDGSSGFPGSTSATRHFKGMNPRDVKIDADKNSGFDQGSQGVQVRQVSRKSGQRIRNPRNQSYVATPQPVITHKLQNNSTAEFYGGPMLKTGPGNNTAGGLPLSGAAAAGGHSVQETQTPWRNAQPVISGNVPGSQNVRNRVALRYQNVPGMQHTYQSAPRADQAMDNVADSGSGLGQVSSPVTVQNRFVYPGNGVTTWSVERQMPYTGRGNGARGAALNGHRYYAEFNGDGQQFMSGGQGSYGIGRERGPNHRPTVFTEPAPWSTNYYDTTDSVGTPDNPGSGGQAPPLGYVSPQPPRQTKGRS